MQRLLAKIGKINGKTRKAIYFMPMKQSHERVN